ncbi:MAG TPA: hypothetical protein VM032_07555 [Vicinamibacterales bacterium]|nr:hypothetical protein [Vicinamibacterales bacterium]
MQQRQPRLGDILDDYCPRERRLTNHVIVAMVGDTVKQTRCTTCDADHEYKHATLPRQRKKSEQSALYTQVLAGVTPKKAGPVPLDDDLPEEDVPAPPAVPFIPPPAAPVAAATPVAASASGAEAFDAIFDASSDDDVDGNREGAPEEGPAHRRLIRAQLPRHEGQAAVTRQAPDFTIRQPNPGRPKRFAARSARSGAPFQGNRQGGAGTGAGNGNSRGGGPQRHGGRPQGGSRPGNRQGGGGRNRSK